MQLMRMMHHKYRCVHCLTPHDALYRRLDSTGRSRNSDIQLLSCNYCCSYPTTTTNDPAGKPISSITGSSLDPYCERELLLVVLDIILLRIYAYRHLLFNRYSLEMELQQQQLVAPTIPSTPSTSGRATSAGRNSSTSQSVIPPYLIQLCCACVVLRSHISIIAMEHHDEHNNSHVDDRNDAALVPNTILLVWSKQLLLSVVTLLGQILASWIGIVLYYHSYSFYKKSSHQKTTTKAIGTPLDSSPNNFYLYIFDLCCSSILYPSILFYTCTSIVHIWENSSTVRTIGTSFLLPLHQIIFLYQILFIHQEHQPPPPSLTTSANPPTTKVK